MKYNNLEWGSSLPIPILDYSHTIKDKISGRINPMKINFIAQGKLSAETTDLTVFNDKLKLYDNKEEYIKTVVTLAFTNYANKNNNKIKVYEDSSEVEFLFTTDDFITYFNENSTLEYGFKITEFSIIKKELAEESIKALKEYTPISEDEMISRRKRFFRR